MHITDKLSSSNKSARRVRRKFEEAKSLSITSLLDELTIILGFLVKNISTEAVKISSDPAIQYPTTITNDELLAKGVATPIKIFPDRIVVGTEALEYGSPADLLENPKKRQDLITYLSAEVNSILQQKDAETCLLVQADYSIPCDYITEIVRAGTAAGYSYIYFATLEDADWLQKYNLSLAQQ
jgi:biopolymer transport protein ExbD